MVRIHILQERNGKMEKRSTKHTWKKWFVGLAALLTVLFFMPTATPQAATKNTTNWKSI